MTYMFGIFHYKFGAMRHKIKMSFMSVEKNHVETSILHKAQHPLFQMAEPRISLKSHPRGKPARMKS